MKFPSYLNDYLTVPVGLILKVEKTTLERKASKICYLEIYTKDHRYLKLHFDNFNECNQVSDKVEEIAFPEDRNKDILNSFAFKYFIPESTYQQLFEDGWDIYKEPLREFDR